MEILIVLKLTKHVFLVITCSFVVLKKIFLNCLYIFTIDLLYHTEPCRGVLWLFIWLNFNPLYPWILWNKFFWNCHNDFRDGDEMVKSLQRRPKPDKTSDKLLHQKAAKCIWYFGSGELHIKNLNYIYMACTGLKAVYKYISY